MKPLTAVNGTVDGNKWNWREQFPSTASTKSTQSTLKEVVACGVWKREHLWTKWTWWTRWTLWTVILEPDPEKAKEYYIKGVLQNDARSKHELDTLITALHNAKLDADGQAVELECMRELFKRCGVKFRDD